MTGPAAQARSEGTVKKALAFRASPDKMMRGTPMNVHIQRGQKRFAIARRRHRTFNCFWRAPLCLLAILAAPANVLLAETGYRGWLRYAPVEAEHVANRPR